MKVHEIVSQVHNFNEKTASREQKKTISESKVLLSFLELHPEYLAYEVQKTTQPDFVLSSGNKLVGIEITCFTTELNSVLNDICIQNFSKKLSVEEIEKAAIEKHGEKAREYTYYDLNGTPSIGTPLMEVNLVKKEFFAIVKKKYDIYHKKIELFDKFILLCDARGGIFITSPNDVQDIVNMISNLPVEKIFDIAVLYRDSVGKTECEYRTINIAKK